MDTSGSTQVFSKYNLKKKKKKNHISFRAQQVIFWTAHQKSVESKVSSCLLADVEISSCGLCYRKICYLGESTQPQYGEKALVSPTTQIWLALAFSLLWDKLGMGPQQAARAPLSCKGGWAHSQPIVPTPCRKPWHSRCSFSVLCQGCRPHADSTSVMSQTQTFHQRPGLRHQEKLPGRNNLLWLSWAAAIVCANHLSLQQVPDKGKGLSPKENCCGGLEELKSQVAEYVKVPRVANVEIISASPCFWLVLCGRNLWCWNKKFTHFILRHLVYPEVQKRFVWRPNTNGQNRGETLNRYSEQEN